MYIFDLVTLWLPLVATDGAVVFRYVFSKAANLTVDCLQGIPPHITPFAAGRRTRLPSPAFSER